MNTTFAFYFLLPVIFGVLILVMGAVFLFIDSRRKKDLRQVELDDWYTTGGKIITAKIVRDETLKNPAANTLASDNFEPVIEYVYTVKDVEYRGNKVFPGDHIYFNEKNAQAILKDHAVNMYVPVKYNPEDPSESSLEKRPSGTNYIHLAGLVLTSFGVMVCCFTSVMVFLILGRYK